MSEIFTTTSLAQMDAVTKVSAGNLISTISSSFDSLYLWGRFFSPIDLDVELKPTKTTIDSLQQIASYENCVVANRNNQMFVIGRARFYDDEFPDIKIDSLKMPRELPKIKSVHTWRHGDGCLVENGAVYEWLTLNEEETLFIGAPRKVIPRQVPIIDSIVAVSAGANHRIALRDDGTVWNWGENSSGGLYGERSGDRDLIPWKVEGLRRIKALSAGGSSNIALREDGTLWAWGNGRLGNDSVVATMEPIQVHINEFIVSISEGPGYHAFAISDGDTLWCWGSNDYGQLGIGEQSSSNGSIHIPIKNTNLPFRVEDIITISCGSSHTLILLSDKSVWGCGDNTWGQVTGEKTPAIPNFVRII